MKKFLLTLSALLMFSFAQVTEYGIWEDPMSDPPQGFRWIQSSAQMATYIEADSSYLGNVFGAYFMSNGILVCAGSVLWDNMFDEVVVQGNDKNESGIVYDCFTWFYPDAGYGVIYVMYDYDDGKVYSMNAYDYYTGQPEVVTFQNGEHKLITLEMNQEINQYDWVWVTMKEEANIQNALLCAELSKAQAENKSLNVLIGLLSKDH